MILFKFQFSGNEFSKKLYYNKKGTSPLNYLNPGENISFDSYFHYLPIRFYKKFTVLDKVLLKVIFLGDIEIIIKGRSYKKDKLISSIRSITGECLIEIPLSDFFDDLYLFVEIISYSKTKLFSIHYFSEQITNNQIDLALIITTFNRENYILSILKKIKNYYGNNKIPFKVYIIDNGSNLNLDQYNFCDYIPNKNLGGSGGFTKGILNALNNNHTHTCLMDDDIEYEPTSMDRLLFLLSYLKPNYLEETISGTILRKDMDTIQYELTGNWNGIVQKINFKNFDLTKFNLINKIPDKLEKKNTYSAWCLVCYPISYFSKNGYPLPLFIRGDDLEFSLRNNISPILLKGFAVWHETFDPKKDRDWVSYYNVRNYMIINFIYDLSSKYYFILFISLRYFYYLFKKNSSLKFMELALIDINNIETSWINEKSDILHSKLLFLSKENNSLVKSSVKIFIEIIKIFMNYSKLNKIIKNKIIYLKSMEY